MKRPGWSRKMITVETHAGRSPRFFAACKDGLAIHQRILYGTLKPGSKKNRWDVTHLASGLSATLVTLDSEAAAYELAGALLKLGDWTQPKEVLEKSKWWKKAGKICADAAWL